MAEEKPEIKPVAKGKLEEKSFGQMMLEDIGAALKEVWTDNFLPAIKDTFSDSLKTAAGATIDAAIFGDGDAHGTGRISSGRGHTQYSNATYQPYREPVGRPGVNHGTVSLDHSRRARANDRRSVVFDSKSEAEQVLRVVLDTAVTYGICTVSNYYEEAGLSSTYQDDQWGWDYEALMTVRVLRNSRGGYYLDMPRPMPTRNIM